MANKTGVEFKSTIPIKMRDGVTLYSDLFIPEGTGKYPVLLQRTPYNRTSPFARSLSLDSIAAGLSGYAVMVQDCRGRFESEGEFHPFVNEINDGYDTIEWIADQDWCDGNVGMYGGSYVGATQWLAAMSQPPALKAITPGITASNYHEGWTYQGGAFELDFNLSWALIHLVSANYENLVNNFGAPADKIGELTDMADQLMNEYSHLSLKDWPALKGIGDFYYRWLEHPEYDDYWKSIAIEEHHNNIDVPALSIGGWFDIFMGGTIKNYVGMSENGKTANARSNQKLLIGPWVHPGMLPGFPGSPVGEEYFGIRSYSGVIDMHGILLRFFDHHLKGIQNGLSDEKPINIFVMGENVWREESEWPLSRAINTNYYMSSNGNANSRNGDGLLGTKQTGNSDTDTFIFDPQFPVPTKGGGLCCYDALGGAGAFDQSDVELRNDVLVFSTQVLDKDIEVTGPITVKLYASTSGKDTDFTAKLVDVYPEDEKAINLTDSIIRARYRNGMEKAELLEPNKVYEYTIDLWSTSNVFKKGHKIRIDVSSSNFPRFDRNLNTGGPIGEETDFIKATQTIFHNDEFPSHVILPMVPR